MIGRWLVTLVLVLPMGWVLHLLSIERLERAGQFTLPDTALPFDAFQAAIAANKLGIAQAAILSSLGLGLVIGVMAASFAALHMFVVRRSVVVDAQFHILWISHSILPFCAISVGLVSALKG